MRAAAGAVVARQAGTVRYMGGWGDDTGLDALIGNLCAKAGLSVMALQDGVRVRNTATERFWFNYTAETVETEAGPLPPAGVLRVELD